MIENDLKEANSIEDIINASSGDVFLAQFPNEHKKDFVELAYYKLNEDNEFEFLEPGDRYWTDKDIEIHYWAADKNNLKFDNGIILFPQISELNAKTIGPNRKDYYDYRPVLNYLLSQNNKELVPK